MHWWLVLLFLVFPGSSFSQQLNHFTLSEADSLQAVNQKPIVVFMHTNWCKYCEAMENSTLKNKELAELLNREYLFVKFDAESQEEIVFKGRAFQFMPTGNKTGVHALAQQLGAVEGKLTYPAIVILNPENEIIFQYQGYISAGELVEVLQASATK